MTTYELDSKKALGQALAPTVVCSPVILSEFLGVKLTIATESLQHTGSFKFRAAYNVALKVRQRKIIAASSGNFGQAIAYACKLLGKTCIVVMPCTSAVVKINAVKGHGATVELIDIRVKSREDRVEEIAQEHPDAYVTSAYDNPHVIEGNATLGTELAETKSSWNSIIVPVGGGGLISGVAIGLRSSGDKTELLGAEPLLANDAARSMKAGYIVANDTEPPTIADGARTVSLGKMNWPIIQKEVRDIIEVSEENIAEAVRLLFQFANIKAEPTGALALGAVLQQKDRFLGRSVCCVVSGGNVDAEVYARLISNSQPSS